MSLLRNTRRESGVLFRSTSCFSAEHHLAVSSVRTEITSLSFLITAEVLESCCSLFRVRLTNLTCFHDDLVVLLL